MGKTSIEWSEFSINPIRARLAGTTGRSGHYCEKVSPGCENCYSSRFQPRVGLPLFQHQRRGVRDGAIELFLTPEVLAQVLRRKKPTKIFWCDMTDMFGRWVPNEWIAACFGVMAATPQHTHQVLTKRAERLPEWFENAPDIQRAACTALDSIGFDRGCGSAFEADDWPLPNVHLGVSAEDQQRADERIPHLLRTPAAVRWVSAEPLLGPIDFDRKGLGQGSDCPECGWMVHVDEDGLCASCGADVMWYGVDWVVVGGESGPGARPMQLQWARDIVRQCRAAQVPVFVKQLGARLHWDPDGEQWWRGPHVHSDGSPRLADRKGGDPSEWPEDLRVREFPR